MSNIKSIGHQSIHSTQSAPAEATQKNSEIVKESKPAEFRPLTKEQQENIKQTRNAESKFAESAIKKEFFDDLPSKPADYHVDKHEPTKDGASRGAQEHVNSHFHEMQLAKVRNGSGSESGGGGSTNDGAKDIVKTAGTKDIVKNAGESKPEILPIGTGPTGEIPDPKALGKWFDKRMEERRNNPYYKEVVNKQKPTDLLPIGTGIPRKGYEIHPDNPLKRAVEPVKRLFKEFIESTKPKENVKQQVNAETESSESVLKAEKFFPSIRFQPATPILDGETEREEEPVTAWESPKTKAPEEHFEIPPGDNSSRIASKNEGE